MLRFSRNACWLFLLLTLNVVQPARASADPVDSLENLLKSAHDTNRVILLNKLSFQYLLRTQFDKALQYGENARKAALALSYARGHAKSLVNIGNVYGAWSDNEKAKSHFLEAYEIAAALNDLIVLSHCTNNLGEVYRTQGNYEKALSYYLQSLEIAEKSGDRDAEGGTWNNVGLVYQAMNNHAKAIECYRAALKIATSLGNRYDASTIMTNLGNLYERIGKPDSALHFYTASLGEKKAIGDEEGVATAHLGLAGLAEDRKDWDDALRHLNTALEIGRRLNHQENICWALNQLGDVHFRRGDPDKAFAFFNESLSIALKINSLNDQRVAYHNLALWYEKKGDLGKAYDFFRKYSVVRDSLFASENSKRIAEMQVRYESARREREMETLKADHNLLQEKNRTQKILFGGIGMVAFASGIALYFRNQAARQKNLVLREKVESQNRELTTVALLVTKKNQAFTQIKSDLEGLASSETQAESVRDVIRSIDREMAFDEAWEMFKHHFEKVHPDFFSKLKSLAPSLTVNEMRLCAYTRANFTTKEIAAITNTTVRSVQQARYRINQKFTDSQGNLSDFLMKI